MIGLDRTGAVTRRGDNILRTLGPRNSYTCAADPRFATDGSSNASRRPRTRACGKDAEKA